MGNQPSHCTDGHAAHFSLDVVSDLLQSLRIEIDSIRKREGCGQNAAWEHTETRTARTHTHTKLMTKCVPLQSLHPQQITQQKKSNKRKKKYLNEMVVKREVGLSKGNWGMVLLIRHFPQNKSVSQDAKEPKKETLKRFVVDRCRKSVWVSHDRRSKSLTRFLATKRK